MEKNRTGYISPLSTRYASREMQYLFSDNNKFRTWRRLWIALAEAERELGLHITEEQIDELKAHAEDVNYDVAEARERVVRHDVMSHVYAYGQQWADFARRYKDLPCLGYTHLQPAQLTTVGKRATLWMNELMMDMENLEYQVATLRFRGAKGTTGTQASFMELFEGDEEKVRTLDRMVAERMGFARSVAVCGQTYSRKTDAYFLAALSGFAQSACKFATDLRILQSFEEMEEPFEASQIGSSAMPYKRNPMRSERICALARYVIQDAVNPAMTAATQWMERTLDDSANKRIAVSEAFLAVDAILEIYMNVTAGLVVYDRVVSRRVMEKLPFMATENVMMEAVKRGGNRQELHEALREHSHAAARKVKLEGGQNDLIDRIVADDRFPLSRQEIEAQMAPEKYVGRAPSQVTEFLREVAGPVLARYPDEKIQAELNV